MKLQRIAAAVIALSLFVGVNVASAQKPDKEEKKPQSAVAAKNKSFATVSATDAAVKSALKAENLDAAKKQIGKTATFVGTVAKIFTPKSNGLVVINFAKNYKEALTGVVRGKDFANFPDLKTLEGKRILITGKAEDYQGRPEVQITDATAIKIVK